MRPAQWPVAVDEPLERGKGARIRAKGLSRAAVRSSQRTVVTGLGLEWLRMALLVQAPWRGRPWVLPVLTRLVPSRRSSDAAGRRHRRLWSSPLGGGGLVARWLRQRRWVLFGDGGCSCVQPGWDVLAAHANNRPLRMALFPLVCLMVEQRATDTGGFFGSWVRAGVGF
jgi:hypothetical protein